MCLSQYEYTLVLLCYCFTPLCPLHSFRCPHRLLHCTSLLLFFLLSLKLLHSVGEALCDPVLKHSLRFDFDINLYASILVCVSEIYDDKATLSQTSASAAWLHGIIPLDKASLYCPTSNSLAWYLDNTILPPWALTIALSQFSQLSTDSQLSLPLYPLRVILSEPDLKA